MDKLLAVAGLTAATGSIYYLNEEEKKNAALDSRCSKMIGFYQLLVAWVSLKQQGKTLASFFTARGISHVAVYGMKELGELLVQELDGTKVEVDYLIDRDSEAVYSEKKVFKPEDELDEVGAIIVTAISSFDEIQKSLGEKVSCPIISLNDVVFGVM